VVKKAIAQRERGAVTHWVLIVRCPHGCRGGHIHGSGGPELRDDMGLRIAHCAARGRPDYRIVLPSLLGVIA
jgi:hypothetical protein